MKKSWDMKSTVEDYLNYCPARVVKDKYYGSRGEIPANPHGLKNVEISVWDSFVEDNVYPERNTALKWQSEEILQPLYEEVYRDTSPRSVTPCANKPQVQQELYLQLFRPLTRLMNYLGVAGNFSVRPFETILDIDFAWYSEMVDRTTQAGSFPRSSTPSPPIEAVTIAIEVRSFWTFDPPDDLVAILKSELSQDEESQARRLEEDGQLCMGKRVVQAVSQIHAYMSINHLQYGVLATYEKFYFLHSLKGGDSSSPSRLEITRVIRRDQTRDSASFTLMEAWLSLVKAAERDYVVTSPDLFPIVERTHFSITDRMKLVTTAELSNLYFGKIKSRNELGTVVQGGIWGEDEKNSVMKIVDGSKCMHSSKLDLEMSAYRLLVDLQEEVVPKVHGYLLINGWIKVLVLSNCGEKITGKQFVERYEEIQRMVKQIHIAGVAHGDLAYRNILVDKEEKLTIIDFSEAKLEKACNREQFAGYCSQDLHDLESLESEAKQLLTEY